MSLTRRGLLTGLASLLAAPAIVRASSLMAIKPVPSLVFSTGGIERVRVFSDGFAAFSGEPLRYFISERMPYRMLREQGIGYFEREFPGVEIIKQQPLPLTVPD